MNRVAFITGAGRRIGRHLAIRFAGMGWNVAVHYGESRAGAERTLADVRAAGGDAYLVQGDVRKRVDMQRCVEQAADRFGSIDLLVNNAGTYPNPVPLLDIEESMWRDVIETNLYGEFFTAQAVARVMLRQTTGGSIVNVASLGAFQTWKNRIPYNVSKGGVVHLTRALARALAPDITVNAVAPGVIEIPDEPATGQLLARERIPMRRHGTTDDIFNAVWFLGTQATYVTGQVILVDGGLNIGQEASQD